MAADEPAAVTKDQIVDSIMRRWPGTIRVFLNHRMKCVGCPIGRLHTVEDACTAHGLALATVLRDLNRAVSGARRL